MWELTRGKARWRWRQSNDPGDFVTLTRFSPDEGHAIGATRDRFAIRRLQDGQSQDYNSLPEYSLRDAALSTC